MSPKSKEQFQAIREERTTHIKEIALELFAENGFENTSINDIAVKAKISKGLMYNYFKNKEDLLKNIMYETLDHMNDNLDPNHDGILEHHELIGYIETTFKEVQDNPKFWKLYFSIMNQPPVIRKLQTDLMQRSSNTLQMVYSYFEQQDYEDPMVEMAYFGALMSGSIMKYLGAPEHFPLEKVKQKIIDYYQSHKSTG